VIVCFVDFGGIVDHQSLNFIFIALSCSAILIDTLTIGDEGGP
jgi:hypothetical protein